MKHKNFINYSIFIFALAGAILISGKSQWFPYFYNPFYMGLCAFLSVGALLAVKFLFIKDRENIEILRLQSSLAVILILNGLGSLGFYKLYEVGFQYDKLAHFAIPFISVVSLSRFFHLRYGANFKKVLAAVVLLIFCLGIGWEFFEFLSDTFFGTQTLGEYGEYILKDTVGDILFNASGIILASIFVLFARRKFGQPVRIRLKTEI